MDRADKKNLEDAEAICYLCEANKVEQGKNYCRKCAETSVEELGKRFFKKMRRKERKIQP